MNVTNCKGCGRLFNALSSERLCPQCRQKLDDKFQEVKQFLNENLNSTMNDIAENCDVSIKQIKQWVREERLTFSENSVEGIDCEQCGKMIRSGRYCDACKAKISNNLMSAINKPEVKTEDTSIRRSTENRMRFLQS